MVARNIMLGVVVFFGIIFGTVRWWNVTESMAQPVPQMTVPEDAPVYVFVTGAVRHPGLYSFSETVRQGEAVQAAGGVVAYADVHAVNLAARIKDGMHIHIPYTLTGVPTAPPENEDTININEASAEKLATLPGIGMATAKKIVKYRNQHSPFMQGDDLRQVKGIGDSKYEELKDKIRV